MRCCGRSACARRRAARRARARARRSRPRARPRRSTRAAMRAGRARPCVECSPARLARSDIRGRGAHGDAVPGRRAASRIAPRVVLIGAAAALAVVLLMMWLRERHVARARAARRSDEVDRELGAVAQLSASLADAATRIRRPACSSTPSSPPSTGLRRRRARRRAGAARPRTRRAGSPRRRGMVAVDARPLRQRAVRDRRRRPRSRAAGRSTTSRARR